MVVYAFVSYLIERMTEQSLFDNSMNDTKHNAQFEEDDKILPLYDFADGIRGKHAQAYQQGHRVLIYKRNGAIEQQEFTLPEGAVVLGPDVRR